ncbi:glycosyl hydrolase [Mucilaginibacter roseus]|uniref:Glycosyl hydrolase n=1 Tax=Mucilaginibacter roseus TaxID=1528868 RepID=A0ABS8U1X0_9SPHI|nr:glycoside hydrolase family 38 C-terminal domain-containing protein [Mucilaginibacter roseus]MCD8739847.1 glycosyl hydrolase [Mucilaginibacter roseus]
MKHIIKKIIQSFFAVFMLICLSVNIYAQQAYFIDGYHGGIWGHYPDWNTRFMVDMLNKHSYWKINLEIEPETWDSAAVVDPEAFAALKTLIADQSVNGRIEYVNPAYAQSYMYNLDGESIIRQLGYGIKKLKATFPGIQFHTYSSEEPCFTNALPGILRSYGFKYASLKNPNTCFGGYTKAFGGELVNWIGPDGSCITTAPRYAIEKLEPNSTWQTIAWNNNNEYINAAIKYGIKHPIGMTLQDAGWKNGPFLDQESPATKKQYTTWRNYFERVSNREKATDWRVSQEDILVSLVWGSQVTQRIAQQVRAAENRILQAEKLTAIAALRDSSKLSHNFDDAWRTLMLAQHHDCWIVPYNGNNGNTWADKVKKWTANTIRQSDSIVELSINKSAQKGNIITVYNTQSHNRRGVVSIAIPEGMMIKNYNGEAVPFQKNGDTALFIANVPSFGYAMYKLEKGGAKQAKGITINQLDNHKYQIETNIYRLIIDANKGGNITSWYDKRYKKQLVDKRNTNGFNSLRGNFYEDGGFKSNKDSVAKITILEQGPVRATVMISTHIAGTTFNQRISLLANDAVVDMQLNIGWKRNVKVGEYADKKNYKWTDYEKPFYNDSNKLLTVFPLALKGQKIYKNAPFAVTASKLSNTFFNSWDSIKNNIILNWVDVMAGDDGYGVAFFTDHTTSYTHGNNFPLGFVCQYSGLGLWGRDYFTDGSTSVRYALLPHKGIWDKSGVWSASAAWNEPLTVLRSATKPLLPNKSFIDVKQSGLVITSITTEGKSIMVRLYNAEGTSGKKMINLNFDINTVQMVELDGRSAGNIQVKKLSNGITKVQFFIPKFGIRTLRIAKE